MAKKYWVPFVTVVSIGLLAGCGQVTSSSPANTTSSNAVATTNATTNSDSTSGYSTTNSTASGSTTNNSTASSPTTGTNTTTSSTNGTYTSSSKGSSSNSTASTTTSSKSTTTTSGTSKSSGTGTTNSPAPTPPPSSPWLQYNLSSKTVNLELIASDTGANGGFNFDGYSLGQMTVTIPSGWTVNVTYQNNTNSTGHSAMIVPYAQHTAPSGFTPAFSGSSTPNPDVGITSGQTQTMHFVATTPGKYAIICGVSGHADAGMWDTFVVSSTAVYPSVVIGSEVLS